LVRMALAGTGPPDELLVVPPGSEIVATNDSRAIACAACSSCGASRGASSGVGEAALFAGEVVVDAGGIVVDGIVKSIEAIGEALG